MVGLRILRNNIIKPHGELRTVYNPFQRLQTDQRPLYTKAPPRTTKTPNFAFAFDIDGVILRGARKLPTAPYAIKRLQSENIPFIFLTNGGGYPERDRAKIISQELDTTVHEAQIVQSHTPFSGYDELKDQTVLVVGGEGDKCRRVAKEYGFQHVVTTSEIFNRYPEIWPFSRPFATYHAGASGVDGNKIKLALGNASGATKVDAIFVFNDPRDWGLDITVILDFLLSSNGVLGTISEKNGDKNLPNRGYQQDGQPHLYFSNADLWWASAFPLSRLGQGGFREALEGVWAAVTGEHAEGVPLQKTMLGKPYQATFEFAEKRLEANRKIMLDNECAPLRRVYMIGDNPESDILGANNFKSPNGAEWVSILTKTGVYHSGKPAHEPRMIVKNVGEALSWALQQEKWENEGT